MKIAAIGSVYLETNYIGLETGGEDVLQAGKEYRADRWETRLGGSATNFAIQATNLGAKVSLIGKVGDDEEGRKVIKLLGEAGVSTDLIVSDKNVKTSVDTGVILAHSRNNIQLVTGNANQKLRMEDINIDKIDADAVYLGGFLKQTSLYNDYPSILRTLKGKGKRIFLDHGRVPVNAPREAIDKLLESLTVVEGYFPNIDEIFDVTREKEFEGAVQKALTMGPSFVAVKEGRDGCTVGSKDGIFHIDGLAVEAVSTVGAGDCFNAGFIIQYLSGKLLKDSADFANKVAAFRVSKNRMAETEDL